MLSRAIAIEAGVPVTYIEGLVRSANHLYKVFSIERRGGGQRRTIEQPSRALKFLQRWLIANVLQDVPIHNAAAAYVVGSNILSHAEKHVMNDYLLRLDFRNFFPSITERDLRQHLIRNRSYLHFAEEDEDLQFVVSVVSRNGGLTIGAPSSPALANQVMYQFDDLLYRWCRERDVTYTRYADDLYFSTLQRDVLRLIRGKVVELLSSIDYPRMSLNDAKTAHTSRKKKRLVTGLSLTSDGRVSLGRKKKREIRGLIHKFDKGSIIPEKISYLAGYLAYARSVEPTFINSLKRKYGENLIRAVTTMRRQNGPRTP